MTIPNLDDSSVYGLSWIAIRGNLAVIAGYIAAFLTAEALGYDSWAGTIALIVIMDAIVAVEVHRSLLLPQRRSPVSHGIIPEYAIIVGLGVAVVVGAVFLTQQVFLHWDLLSGSLPKIVILPLGYVVCGILAAWFGTLLPAIAIEKNESYGSSIAVGRSQRPRILAELALGPGLVLISLEVAEWITEANIPDAPMIDPANGGLNVPVALYVSVWAVASCYLVIITAVVLSRAYARGVRTAA